MFPVEYKGADHPVLIGGQSASQMLGRSNPVPPKAHNGVMFEQPKLRTVRFQPDVRQNEVRTPKRLWLGPSRLMIECPNPRTVRFLTSGLSAGARFGHPSVRLLTSGPSAKATFGHPRLTGLISGLTGLMQNPMHPIDQIHNLYLLFFYPSSSNLFFTTND